MNHRHFVMTVLAAALLLPACSPTTDAPPLAGAAIGGPFTLTDQTGARVSDTAFAGKYRLMYFGYTFCPDVCPVDVQKLATALRLVEKHDAVQGAKIVPIFVTVDPQRDTPANLKQFIGSFHPRMVGLTGSPAEIDRVAKAYAIFYKHQPARADGSYLVDHSTQAYLFDPMGKPLELITHDMTAEQAAAILEHRVR